MIKSFSQFKLIIILFYCQLIILNLDTAIIFCVIHLLFHISQPLIPKIDF